MNGASGNPKWHSERPRYRARLFLSQDMLSQSAHLHREIAGFDIVATMLDPGLPIPADLLQSAQTVLLEVRCEQHGAFDRLQRIINEAGGVPIIAAVRDPGLSDVRRLMRMGVTDVLPLPLNLAELEGALERIAGEMVGHRDHHGPKGKTVAAIKSRGGVGATTLLTQLGCLLAKGAGQDGEACFVDLDVQFGNGALYLGQLPALGLSDLVDAGERLDLSLLRAALAHHKSGLHYLGCPHEMIPLDSLSAEQVVPVIDLIAREFRTVLIDLPQDWTDWSVSIAGQADLILLVCELSVASLHHARRQLEFLRQRELGEIPVEIVMNKVSKGLFKTVNLDDATRILGRPISYSIADDAVTARSALDRGEPVFEVEPRSRMSRDLAALAKSLQSQLAVAK